LARVYAIMMLKSKDQRGEVFPWQEDPCEIILTPLCILLILHAGVEVDIGRLGG